ncbi:MAG: transporter [Acidobacteria bacterium]|nr:transporter [Acidobacteriota bacterium]MBK8813458.1 transporter [Acidobacteriota bacterium]
MSRQETGENEVTQESRDLGFGAKVASESRLRFLNRDGSFNVARTGMGRLTTLNVYHYSLTMSWSAFLGLVLLLYFVSNVFFGLIYSAFGADALVDTSSIPFENIFVRAFFFSVQTFATIGYGTIHPVGFWPNMIVTIESYYSLLANALITGVVFARFARPTARIIFSENAIVAPYRDLTGLMFRIANSRNNQLIDVNAQVAFSRFCEENGRIVRKFDLLKLERSNVSFFPLAWTVVHPIDESSPMFGMTEADFKRIDAELLILLSATDETFAQSVHARSSYKTGEIRFGYKFATMYNPIENHEPISIDIRKLSAIEKAD